MNQYDYTLLKPPFSTGHLDAGVTYPRLTILDSGEKSKILLATCDQGQMINDRQVWPIFKSFDSGKTWRKIVDFQNDYSQFPLQMNPVIYKVPEGTNGFNDNDILLSGILKPANLKKTLLVIYRSQDGGYSWSRFSEVDCGGPAIYDNTPESITSAIWEPYFYVNRAKDLTICYSDERKKKQGILQALVLRMYKTDTNSWSDTSSMIEIKDSLSRPGMISVTKLKNESYIGVFEIVNQPSVQNNQAIIYTAYSDDGVGWSIGEEIKTEDGYSLGSSPYITNIVKEGKEVIIVSGKWMLKNNQPVNGQSFFIKENVTSGKWQRFPYSKTYDCIRSQVENIAYSQCIVGLNDGIGQLVTVNNEESQLNDLVFSYLKFPDFYKYFSSGELSGNTWLFPDNESFSNNVVELGRDGKLKITLEKKCHIKEVYLRYKSVSFSSTVEVKTNEKLHLVYLKKTNKLFEWCQVSIVEEIDHLILQGLEGSKLVDFDCILFYK